MRGARENRPDTETCHTFAKPRSDCHADHGRRWKDALSVRHRRGRATDAVPFVTSGAAIAAYLGCVE